MKKCHVVKRNAEQKEGTKSVDDRPARNVSQREWMVIAAYCAKNVIGHAQGAFGCDSLLIETEAEGDSDSIHAVTQACRDLGLVMVGDYQIDICQQTNDAARDFLLRHGLVTAGIARVLRDLNTGDQLPVA